MTETDHPRLNITYLLAGSIALLIVGLFVANSGSCTLAACHSYGPYELVDVSLRQISYNDGCNGCSVSTAKLLPLAGAGVLLTVTVATPTRGYPLNPVARKRSTILLGIACSVLLVAAYIRLLPLVFALVVIAFSAILRAMW